MLFNKEYRKVVARFQQKPDINETKLTEKEFSRNSLNNSQGKRTSPPRVFKGRLGIDKIIASKILRQDRINRNFKTGFLSVLQHLKVAVLPFPYSSM